MNWLQRLICPSGQYIQQLEYERVEHLRRIQRLETRADTLIKALNDNLNVPPCTEFTQIEDAKNYYPFSDLTLNQYEKNIADAVYYSFPYPQWLELLTPIQKLIDDMMDWKTNISDCDDFALIMNSKVAQSFILAGYPIQGAFFTLWSSSHAYNAFKSHGYIYIYEPQTNEVKGTLGQTTGKWGTKKVWMPGNQL